MTDQTIVAVYDTPAHAELAVQDLLKAGVPESAVTRQTQEGSYTGSSKAPAPRTGETGGFWSNLFGGSPDHDTAVYDRSVGAGGSAVSVRVGDDHVSHVMDILERHNPVDLDERAGAYGLTQTTAAQTRTPAAGAPAAATAAAAADGGRIQLSEESLAVGKRVVNKGTTRIRRFVVETPFEQQVSLRDEHVTIERHKVSDGRPATDSFSDKTVELTESAEEAVVSKSARVVEEIDVKKQATDRVETVRDTLKREDVEIVKTPGETGAKTGTDAAARPAAARPNLADPAARTPGV